MAEILHVLDAQMERPEMYGSFHLAAFALTLLLAVLLPLLGRDAKDRTFRRLMFVCWLVLVLFETYKQINFSFNYNGGKPYWDYQWYAFPFQSCSAPLYVLPFVFLSKPDTAVRRAAASYMAFWSLFGGLAVMFWPSTVFTETVGINIQTMVWHGMQVVLGVYTAAYYRRKLCFRFFAAGIVPFLLLVGAALALDMTVPLFIDETFNMFFISPLFPSTLPILSTVWEKAPWGVFLAVYILGFTLSAYLMYMLARLLTGKQGQKHKGKKAGK